MKPTRSNGSGWRSLCSAARWKTKAAVLAVLALMVVTSNSCQNPLSGSGGQGTAPEEDGGTLTGYVFNPGADNSDVEVVLESVEGGQTETVSTALASGSRIAPQRAQSTRRTRANADGSYRFRGVRTGRYTVRARDGDRHAFQMNIFVIGNVTIEINVMVLGPVGNIAGNVTLDGDDSDEGIMAYIAGTSYLAMTDADGNYTIANVPEGQNYNLVFARDDYMNAYETVSVTAGATTAVPDKVLDPESASPQDSTSWLTDIGDPIPAIGQDGDLYLNLHNGDVWLKANGEWVWQMNIKGTQEQIWQGTHTNHPDSPELNWAYYNSADGNTYIFDGSVWQVLAYGSNTSPPAQVADLTASVTGVDGEISLAWTNPDDIDFDHSELTWAYGEWESEPISTSGESVSVTGLSGVDYLFTVRAVDTAGNSSEGSSVVKAPVDTSPPAEVSNLEAVSGHETIELIWTDPTDLDLASVMITWTPADGESQPKQMMPGTESATVSLIYGAEYTFRVRAVDLQGQASEGLVIVASTGEYVVGGLGPAGGTIVYDDEADGHDDLPGFRYLEALLAGIGFALPWGPLDTMIGSDGTELGDGATNTEEIYSWLGRSGAAAHYCHELEVAGYDDWFLPSVAELQLIYSNHVFFELLPGKSWSSSEASPYEAYSLTYHGNILVDDKEALVGVVPCRAF